MSIVLELLPDIPRLDEFAQSLATSADGVRTASESIAANAQEQTMLMAALAESAGLLAAESSATVSRLESTQSDARSAATDLTSSLHIVEELLSSVQRLAELSTGTAAAMDDFGRLMGEIGSMTEFVEDVSDETQLLALNAAIEAARAGTHGLGFAVVAGEVGRLAKATSDSTHAIKDLVEQIQAQAEITIASVRESADRSAESAPIAIAARASLERVAALARDVTLALQESVAIGRDHAETSTAIRHETQTLAETAESQGRQAIEAAFSTQRLAYYGAEIMYFSRPAHPRDEEITTLRCATQLPPGYPPSRAWERFAQLVCERSGGRLTVELQLPFAGSELEMLMQVRSGQLDFVSVTTYIAGSLLPLAQVFDLPFLFPSAAAAHRVLDGGLGARVLAAFEPFGITGIGYFENGIRHMSNSTRAIATPGDVRGLKMRIQDSVVYLALMHAFSAAPKVMPFGGVYDALRDGTLDGQENPLTNIYGAKLHEVQRHLTLTAHTYNTQVVLGNSETMARLSDDHRAVVEAAFAEVIPWHRQVAHDEEVHALAELRTKMNVRDLTDAERGVFVRAGHFVWERMQPLFPDDIYDLLLGGNAHTIEHRQSAEALRAARRKFQIHDIIESIDTAIGAVRSSATTSAKHGKEQTPRLLELGERSAEMSERNVEIASRFTDLLMRFASAQDEVHATREVVRGLAESVHTLAQMAMESRHALTQFGALMRQIGEIITLVRGVSDRTNLLALNAAIEAARAGDHGRGFAVVATEVRSLADKTRASTQQMRGVLADLDRRGKAAATAIASGVGEAERSAKQAGLAEAALARIDTFTDGIIETLAEAQREATTEGQRAFAMRGNFEEMSMLIDYHSDESLRSIESTHELERERQLLFAEETGQLAGAATATPNRTG